MFKLMKFTQGFFATKKFLLIEVNDRRILKGYGTGKSEVLNHVMMPATAGAGDGCVASTEVLLGSALGADIAYIAY